jgi:hypothetical protein
LDTLLVRSGTKTNVLLNIYNASKTRSLRRRETP